MSCATCALRQPTQFSMLSDTCRDPWFRLAHDMVTESLANSGPLRGVLFWEWDSGACVCGGEGGDLGGRGGKLDTPPAAM